MGEKNTNKNIASASEDGNNFPGKPAESMNNKEEASSAKKENEENNGVDETMDGKAFNQTEDSVGKDDSVKTLSVEGNEQNEVVPQEVAELDTVKEDTADQYNEPKEAVEQDSEENKAVEQDNESKEVAPQEVAEPDTEKEDTVERDVEPKEVVEQEGEKNKAVEQDNASENLIKAAAEEETPKKGMSGGITGDAEASGEDAHMKEANDINEEKIVDNNEVKEGKKNNVDIGDEKMEADREQEADATENKSVEGERNSEEKGVDVKDGLETEQVEGKLEGSSNEEDIDLEDKGSKKRKRKENAVDKTKNAKKDGEAQKTPVSSVSTRPVRERKSVERLVASIEKDVVREIFVEKGPGTALKDIPNVAYKLSKKKNDETFKQLHPILFGRRGKAIQMKNHVSQFSGFVWHDNEGKNKMKVREKFDKLVKEKLIEFCDVLDIPIANKVSTKKEDIVTKIMDFLASPHPTTDESLSEKGLTEKITKRKRSVRPSSPALGSAKSSSKRRRKTSEKLEDSGKGDSGSEGESDKEKDDTLTENQGNGNGKLNRSEDESSEKKSSESEDAMDEDTTHRGRRLKKISVKVESPAKRRTKAKTPKNPDQSDSEEAKKMDPKNHKQSSNKSAEKMGSARKGRISTEKKQVKAVPEKESNIKTKTADPKGKPKEEKLKPSDKVLRNQICQILKEVDFNTATFTDILKLLGKHFKTDLTPRKASIKIIIQEELTKMADAGDDDDEEEEEQNPTPEAAKINA